MKPEAIAAIFALIFLTLAICAYDQYAARIEVEEALKLCESETALDKILEKYREMRGAK